ncbi:MAG: DUF1501 domain-containing protein [Planctomycetaceae bacterium]|jgi:hypothetical protein|nr:DUF1501 domain-containing protein [Planctomycetaceae bacterium]MBT6154443.1 DUF1501 domain-containing protein [Planctomycetaceae bacterium]MBT6487254.1 DUF1501 domain-containing protein [Planctomycetaceae bacterium]MBT6498254.1 DUF1501 domain-containing protein [Planctomycetaceae bacterium]
MPTGANHSELQQQPHLHQQLSNDLIRVGSRRWFLQTGMAGIGGLSLPQLLQSQAMAEQAGSASPSNRKAVILFWLSGGPSHIDMWDPKPEAPSEIRSPFDTISTKVPGISFTDGLPLQASIADKLSIIRSVDCKSSNHTPITMQAGNPLARRTNDGKDGGGYPSMGSIAAKFRGANDIDMPAFVGLAKSWSSDVWSAGQMGSNYAPVKGLELSGKFAMPKGVAVDRLQDRDTLRQQFDGLRRDLDQGDSLQRQDRFTRQAYEMVVSGKVQQAFDLGKETAETKEAYGRDSVGQKALLARRLVESGVTFILVSGAWGYFDHHGDSVRWGGIEKGLKPLLPRVDRAMYTLVNDLEQRGLLDDTLVMMMGEFGRSPVINKDAGRDHWTNVMSMAVAGGGLPHGQVIGSTDSRGGGIKTAAVRPQDIAATTFRHLGIDLNAHWTSSRGRPTAIVTEGGRPIPELI